MAFDLKVSSPYAVHPNLKSFLDLFPRPFPVPNLLPPKKKESKKEKLIMGFTSLLQYFGCHFNNISIWKNYKNLLLLVNLLPLIII